MQGTAGRSIHLSSYHNVNILRASDAAVLTYLGNKTLWQWRVLIHDERCRIRYVAVNNHICTRSTCSCYLRSRRLQVCSAGTRAQSANLIRVQDDISRYKSAIITPLHLPKASTRSVGLMGNSLAWCLRQKGRTVDGGIQRCLATRADARIAHKGGQPVAQLLRPYWSNGSHKDGEKGGFRADHRIVQFAGLTLISKGFESGTFEDLYQLLAAKVTGTRADRFEVSSLNKSTNNRSVRINHWI